MFGVPQYGQLTFETSFKTEHKAHCFAISGSLERGILQAHVWTHMSNSARTLMHTSIKVTADRMLTQSIKLRSLGSHTMSMQGYLVKTCELPMCYTLNTLHITTEMQSHSRLFHIICSLNTC